MSHCPWPVSEFSVDATHRVAIGQIGIGIFNRAPQPVCDSIRTVALVMAGEFCRDAMGRQDVTGPDEQAALDLYVSEGPEFARQLNGQFVIAILDGARRRLLITNDRHGLYPLYHTTHSGRLNFAPEINVCRVASYWTVDRAPYRPDIRFGEAVEETRRLLRRAVRRLSEDRLRPSVYLRDGLDPRTVLGMGRRRPILSIIVGQRACRDVRLAARIAHAAGMGTCRAISDSGPNGSSTFGAPPSVVYSTGPFCTR